VLLWGHGTGIFYCSDRQTDTARVPREKYNGVAKYTTASNPLNLLNDPMMSNGSQSGETLTHQGLPDDRPDVPHPG
jgi:hypothetical protein